MSTLFKSEQEHLRHIYWSTRRQFTGKKSPSVIWKSLRLFVNTRSAVDKCCLPNRDNLMQPIHSQLSQKLKTFFRFFNVFSKSRLRFEYSQNKDDTHTLFISEGTACEKRCYIYVQKVQPQITLPKGTWQTSLNSV